MEIKEPIDLAILANISAQTYKTSTKLCISSFTRASGYLHPIITTAYMIKQPLMGGITRPTDTEMLAQEMYSQPFKACVDTNILAFIKELKGYGNNISSSTT